MRSWWRRDTLLLAGSLALAAGAAAVPDSIPPLQPRLASMPLAPPLDLTGGFGEFRIGHFHAGLDFGTGQRVGQSVLAPLDGYLERVRTSGVGYGRSLYLKVRDGRLLVFGHLDAFDGPVAAYLRALQDSSGQYEQDLWPEPGRFAYRAGQRIAWSGQSGAGGPHLHFEVRRGDMTYHPLRSGVVVADRHAPGLVSLTLEPLDDRSFVERGAAPFTVRLGAAAETVLVEGRVRAVVGARDGVWQGVDRMVPWSIGLEWGDEKVTCRFDSVSWATDMEESDYLYDSGRIVGDKGLLMWAPAGFRPRVFTTGAPLARDAGTIEVKPGDPPRAVRLTARDLGGGTAERMVWLRSPRPRESGPDTTRTGAPGRPATNERLEVAALPGGFLRISDRGARELRGVRLGLEGNPEVLRPATWRDGRWTAVVPTPPGRSKVAIVMDSPLRQTLEKFLFIGDSAGLDVSSAGGFNWRVPEDARFESAVVIGTIGVAPATPRELVELMHATLGPATHTLRKPAKLTFGVNDHRGLWDRTDVYRWNGDEWSRLGATRSPDGRRLEAESRRLGTFAVLADTMAPRVTLHAAPPRPAKAGAYSRWALEAGVTEQGSGVDARATYFQVDGRRVPTEWDSEVGVLRWRPHRPPAAGSHSVEIVAADRAGNLRRVPGSIRVR